MKTITFKTAIKKLGYTLVKYRKGYNYRAAFAADKDGQMWYFVYEDLRADKPTFFRRKVEDENDYHGETNLFDIEDVLTGLGYKIHEKRQKCDYEKQEPLEIKYKL